MYSRERLLGIIASARDAIITIDEDQKITLFNDAAEKMFQFPADKAIGQSLDRFIPARFHEIHRDHVRVFAETGVTTRAMGSQRPLMALRSDGVEFPVEATISQIVVGGHRLFTAIVRDISERKRAEEIQRKQEAEMAHLSRLSTAGQMASGLAHELNQPLAAIMNYASVALLQAESQKTSPPVLLDALREIMNETRRAGAIISRMKTFVRKQQTESAPVEVNALVEESLNLLSFELRHQEIRPRRVLAEKLPLVMADPIQIEQVIVNLVYNAMDAMKGSSPAIDALTIQTALQSGGRAVEVSVVDRGPGIAPDNMARLFEAFFTTKTNGLGMGLNICRTIIESHGGRLEAAANPGGGMRFFFTLPVADGAAS